MKQVPDYLKSIAESSRPDQMSASDYGDLAMHVHMCELPLDEWLHDDGFWEDISPSAFTVDVLPAVSYSTGYDQSLANLVLSAIPGPMDRAKNARKAVEVMFSHVHGFVMMETGLLGDQDPTLPLKMLGQLFQAASGGLVIASASRTSELPLSVQSSAFTCGLAAITDASKSVRTELAGKLPGFNC